MHVLTRSCWQKPASTFFPSVLRVPHKESRYCGLCYKNSPGLDHHCTWLNTCIAESNYEAFYCLVVSATCQTLLQTVIGILMCTLWQSEVKANAAEGWDQAVIALLWIHNAACLSLTNSFVLLAGFHTYLLRVGMGTYDFILANGSDGLCTRMLKCNCLRRKKTGNRKRSHVQHGDVDETKSAKGSATRSRRGRPGCHHARESLSSVVTAVADVPGAGGGSGSARGEQKQRASHHKPGPVQVKSSDRQPFGGCWQRCAPTLPDMVLSVGVNESEGIFEEVDLSSPRSPRSRREQWWPQPRRSHDDN